MFIKLVTLGQLLINLAHAGKVFDYYCSVNSATKSGAAIQQIAYHTFFTYDSNECPGSTERTFEAFKGPIHPLLGFKEYCGGRDPLNGQEHSDRFCGNVDLIGDAGLHISLDGHDVALGKANDAIDSDPSSDEAKAICKSIGLEAAQLEHVTTSVWWDVRVPVCV